MPTDLETLLTLSCELTRASPELRRYVQGLQNELRNLRISLALQQSRHEERVEFDLACDDEMPALLRPQI